MRETTSTESLSSQVDAFVARCRALGLAATHQRRVIFRAIAETGTHPSPELVYERASREMPSISLATVYKNVKIFKALGLIRGVIGREGVQRLDANLRPHHHLLCTRCTAVVDLYDDALDAVRATTGEPLGFEVERYEVHVYGVCDACRRAAGQGSKQSRQ